MEGRRRRRPRRGVIPVHIHAWIEGVSPSWHLSEVRGRGNVGEVG